MATITVLRPLKDAIRPSWTNAQRRPREHLLESEVRAMIRACAGINRERNKLLILMTWMHGLRVSEVVRLKWSTIDWKSGKIWIARSKGSDSGLHPLDGEQMRLLHAWQRHQGISTEWIFNGWSQAPISKRAVQDVVRNAGREAGIPFPVHTHQLRHACGYWLINKGVDVRIVQQWLGHRSISNTMLYTKLSTTAFDKIYD